MRVPPEEIRFRAAKAADSYALAELMILAGDGIFEFLLEGIAPREMLAGLVAKSVQREPGGGFSLRHCWVAERATRIVGMVNAYPAAWLEHEEREMLPADRVAALDPIDQVQEWGSYLISGIAVRPDERRQRIASRLMDFAILRAEEAAFSRLSANVWADNQVARAFFASQGFNVEKTAEVPEHPGLGHTGGGLLMVRDLTRQED